MPKCIFPGSFNPLHLAHQKMASLAAHKLKLPIWFELSVVNVEKPTLENEQTVTRLQQNFGDAGVVLTRAKSFVEKSQLFPKATFIVGADTIVRVDDIRFYQNDQERFKALKKFKEDSVSFLVFGRSIESQFLSDDVSISAELRSICRFVPRSEFDIAISSTEIRSNES